MICNTIILVRCRLHSLSLGLADKKGWKNGYYCAAGAWLVQTPHKSILTYERRWIYKPEVGAPTRRTP